jgi:hypothetical protein
MPVPRLVKAYAGNREIDKIFGNNQALYNSFIPIFNYSVNFEGTGETKTGYAAGNVTLSGLTWTLTDALIGTTASDYKEGLRSGRPRGYATSAMTMIANKTDGIGTISFLYRRFGTDTQIEWIVDYSLNSGSSWTQAGTFTAPASDTVQTFTATINQLSNNVRMRIRANTANTTLDRRVNIDNILITGYRG